MPRSDWIMVLNSVQTKGGVSELFTALVPAHHLHTGSFKEES
jgi:hypothetical protein